MNFRFKILAILILVISVTIGCSSSTGVQPTLTTHPTSTRVSPTFTPPPTNTPTPTAVPPTVHSYRYIEQGDYIAIIQVGDIERWFAIHIPPGYQPGVLTPLVVNIHGRGSSALTQNERTWMSKKADEEGFIAVHPQALGQPSTWWGAIPDSRGKQDVNFFEAMMKHLERELSIDPNRVYVTGISNGGSMANRLACEMSGQIAAVAPVSAGHVAFNDCQIDSPVSVIAFHGTDDRIIPYEGAPSDIPSVQTWVEAWADRNGCVFPPKRSIPYEGFITDTWGGCRDNVEVVLFTVEGGEHEWPIIEMGTHLDAYASSITATDEIWEFFKTHPKKNP